ncbi:hypothetical protein LSAT2_021627 [Lamellibrachia satsuma]|nr:hypothetical protein LSAT2_021627 [Lamellibrachia satsuma]
MSNPRPTSARPSSSRPSSAGRPSSASSNHQVLPPIITNEKDRQFLATVTSHINDELDRIDLHNGEQVFVVYKGAFDMVINYVTSYKPLLTMIKAEYEDIVESIQQGERDAFYLSGKLKAMSTEPCTLRNYRRRADELEQKMSIIQTDNERLKKQLSELRAARESRQMKTNSVQDAPKKVVRTDRRRVPGLTLEQSTDLRTLKRELEKLEKQLRELSLTHRTRYLPKNITDQLKDQLAAKVTLRDELLEQTDILKMKRKKAQSRT